MQRLCDIIHAQQLTDHIYAITLEAGELGRLAQPGQFLHVRCGGDVLLRRPISVCDAENETLKIVFEVKGAGTRWLAEKTSGQLDILGPLGTGFSVEGQHILLVGGGIGTPPLLYAARAAKGSTTAILGFGSRSQVILQDEFQTICDNVILTTDDGSAGEPGQVTGPLENELQSGTYDMVLTCGPKPMLRAVANLAAQYNVPCQVSTEERMACGVGACLGCTVTMRNGDNLRACADGPVFDAGEVNWDV
ncbi:MAG: dihydroorotate dehydrogenase electron transfer subunit [Oscillospiraceae bacterium]|nr:dihydroorotate dehydrogenase electron transfer subunit [Oscillospiraceae bacterium]